MRERYTIVRFLKYIRAVFAPVLLFMLTASPAFATPTVTSVNPPDNSNPPLTTTISATFSEPMDPATITNSNFNASKFVKIKDIAAGFSHTVALRNDGTVVAWGDNNSGQSTMPAALSGVIDIAAGVNNTAVLKNDGTVVAWGSNSYGETTVPADLSEVISISMRASHTLALKNNGTVVAWGSDYYGQSTVPTGLSGVIAIGVGANHSVALKDDGTVIAWGNNSYGQSTVPSGLSGVIAIGAGGQHTVALRDDGTVVAWGNNDFGQSTVPTGLSGVIGISAGFLHTLALKSDGTVVAWGYNYFGQCTVPAGLTGVIGISGGHYNTMALKSDGSAVAWGRNDYGQTTVPTSANEAVIPGNVVYDQPTNTATFTPAALLEPESTYFGTVTTGVHNIAGNAIAADVRWTFSPVKVDAAITLAGLNQVYDGIAKTVTATTEPSGLTVAMTYNGVATPPTEIGSYAVVATVTDSIYKGSSTGTLIISKPTFTVGVSVIGGNGNISCESPIIQGENSICTILPALNYHLASLTDDSVNKIGSVTANSYTITNVTTNHAIIGQFAPNPVANAGLNQTIPCAGPSGAQVTLDGSASTNAITYTWTGPFGTASGVNPSVTVPWGMHTVTLTVGDVTGHTATSTVVITVTDNIPPLLNSILTGTNGTIGWYVSPITINLSATDSCSGVKEVHYSVDGIEQTVTGNSTTFNINSDGSHAVSYWAIDNAGNIGATAATTVKIDSTPPIINSTSPAAGATNVLTSASVTITLSENVLQGATFGSITLKKGNTTVTATKSISGNILTIKPSKLNSRTTYTVSIPINAVMDAAGNNLAVAKTFSFTTK